MPDEIIAFRKKYHFTQIELARLLQWGDATIRRYEKGSLQEKSHDIMLRLAMDPRVLKSLILNSSDVLNKTKYQKVMTILDNQLKQEMLDEYMLIFHKYEMQQIKNDCDMTQIKILYDCLRLIKQTMSSNESLYQHWVARQLPEFIVKH